MRGFTVAMMLAALALGSRAFARALPPDVQSGFWAARGVQEALANHVMSVESDGRFHGEAKVTQTQAVIALAKLARALETDQWHAVKSAPVPDSVVSTLKQKDWQNRPVTRYMLASLLARFGDYVANGITRAPAGSKDTNQSEVMPAKASIKAARTNPSYDALTYLVERHEIAPDSPLLKPNDKPISSGEMSQALAQMVIGLNNHLTSMGHDAQGSTPDASFHTQKSQPKQP